MRIIIIFITVALVGGYVFYHFSGNSKKTTLAISNSAFEYSTSTSESSSSPFSVEKSLVADHVNSSSANISQPENSILRPEEAAIFNAWGEQRGYDLDGSLTISYESIGDEELRILATQNDPKAHLVLANRIIAAQKRLNVSYDALDKAQEHLYEASVLGYTSTLETIAQLKFRTSNRNHKLRKSVIADAYKFLYVGIKRGDPNSETSLTLYKSGFPISEDELQEVMKNADLTYNDLSEKRKAMGLPPFNNETPPEVQAVISRIRGASIKN